MTIAIAIYGSIGIIGLAIGIVHLLPSSFQIDYKWKWWAFAISWLGAVYAFCVAIQFTAGPGNMNLYSDRVAFTALILTTIVAIGLAHTYFEIPMRAMFLAVIPINSILVLLTLFSDLVVSPEFVIARSLPFLGGMYWEAEAGILQPWIIYYLAGLFIWGSIIWVRHKPRKPLERPVIGGTVFWLIIVVIDLLEVFILPDAPSIQAFGFIGFSASFIFVSLRHAREAHDELIDTRSRADAILASSSSPIVAINGRDEVVFTNRVFQEVFSDFASDQLSGILSLIQSADRVRISNAASLCRKEMKVQVVQISLEGIAGVQHQECHLAPWLRVSEKEPGIIASILDITEHVRKAEERRHQASHDTLTGLSNRLALDERLSDLIQQSMHSPTSGSWAILYMDLNRFKPINDTHGHLMGDQVLIEVSERIRKNAPRRDLCFRIGGDEFVVIVPGVKDDMDALFIAKKIRDAIGTDIIVGSEILSVGVSIGITVHPRDGLSADHILDNADTAMYGAKKGGGSIHFHSEDSQRAAESAMKLEKGLNRALQEDEICVLYQPFVDAEGRIRGLEALVRWQNPETGILLPDQFIPAAIRMRDLSRMEGQIFDIVSRDSESILESLPDVQISLNVSTPASARHLSASLASTPDHYSLEFTEEIFLSEDGFEKDHLEYLQNSGFRIVLDKFGSGITSLSSLTAFPFDEVKISLERKDTDRKLKTPEVQRALLTLASDLGISTVLIGIEEAEDLEAVGAGTKCLRQGFYLHRPMTLDQILSLAADNS